MTTLFFIKPADVFLEIGQATLKVRQGPAGIELPVERKPNGQITAACREQLAAQLRKFVRQRARVGRPRAFCAIEARGVSMRRVALPHSAKEHTRQLIELQIEKEFPLGPDELAWGCLPAAPGSDDEATRDMIVVAVKRDVIEDYARILAEANLNPVFTLGALAVQALCRDANGEHAVLDIGATHSEFMTVRDGVPEAVRCLAWGDRQLTASPDAAGALADAVRQGWAGGRLYMAGTETSVRKFIPELEGRLGRGVDCRPLEVPPGEGQSAAILGLRQFAESSGRCPPLVLEAPPSRDRAERAGMPAYVKWASLAAVLGLACAAMRYAETFWRGPALARQVAAWQAVTNNQPAVDRELSFYQYLATNRPPYLAALAQLAEAAGRGTSIGTLTMDRQGDLSLRGVMPSSQQATEFRSKLVRSGWFTEVVLEEQTPVGNEPKVNVRIGAHWRHAATGQAATAKDKDSPGPDAPPSPEREPDASPGPSEPPAPTVILTP